MFTKNSKVEMLKRVPLFADCSRRELAEVAGIADELHLPAGRTLIKEGATGREFIIIVDGTVELRRGGRRIAKKDGANFFGEAALLTGARRNATLTTTSPVRALVITDTAFRRLLRESHTIQTKVLTALASRLADPD